MNWAFKLFNSKFVFDGKFSSRFYLHFVNANFSFRCCCPFFPAKNDAHFNYLCLNKQTIGNLNVGLNKFSINWAFFFDEPLMDLYKWFNQSWTQFRKWFELCSSSISCAICSIFREVKRNFLFSEGGVEGEDKKTRNASHDKTSRNAKMHN